MSRPVRLEYAGALYHVTSRGNERKPIYLEDDDFELFLECLAGVCERFNWVIHSYCLMTNHYHLLVETPDGNLSKGMRQLNGVFTQDLNRKHKRVGHLFQGRYKAILVDKESYLLELCRYIVLNPVRARMVDSPQEWPWSSWGYTVGVQISPTWLATDALLKLFGNQRQQAVASYMKFVIDGIGKTIWGELRHQVYLGDDAFVERHLKLAPNLASDLSEVPLKQRRSSPLALKEYVEKASSSDEAIIKAYSSGGYTLKQIGDYFALHYSRVSRIVKGKY